MSTLYKPVEIISTEQAEALPEGTVITNPGYFPQEKFGGLWGREGNTSAQLAEEEGWTALVPIEAEEETRIDPEVFAELDARLAYMEATHALPPGELDVRHVKRLVTPWQEADQ